ncbi:MAG: hypothetical protein NTNFB02_15080 [Nitrospira sp.]
MSHDSMAVLEWSVSVGHARPDTNLNDSARGSIVRQAPIRIRSIDLIHKQDYKAETTIKVS